MKVTLRIDRLDCKLASDFSDDNRTDDIGGAGQWFLHKSHLANEVAALALSRVILLLPTILLQEI